ncbi:phosphonate metabolism protein/1,5-bisphosphokinase (PRPP-forming) PhnN [Kaistia dalseonensis]|uniref:Ribose 1,5-bisphosphate phosphokinase PhnN n=1 Tax=Kaistia dalseonensis TaxID=410840 RepID=A0ABU0H8G6_9HYPH|nr:phosphonate metabolism protein/1,5-bisphosphokinase (PRPP-forming) PhnN [Kaistia dalseonensis]MCX5495998.1 phosphonate metabolism protein/1,5-bisphosphokinase (PRPP-forming) PhnN [Kaistia dalseonensis]MDQ0438601.1 ribose 1,5-bisphosphokinase [Kaistia dalseonensis]
MGTGCFVAIVGPSGAGKDTLINHARRALAGEQEFLFVRRLVTRAANAFEDHDTIDLARFEAGEASGAFALSWRAHGLGYALPLETIAATEAGTIAVCNLSRGAIHAARARFARVFIVSVTAPVDVLAARLAKRGRETAEAVAERLGREAACMDGIVPDLIIQNDRPIAETGAALVDFLRALHVGSPAG